MSEFRLKAETNVPAFNAALMRWIDLRTKALPDALREEMRHLGGTLISFTPPKSRKQGESALRRDVDKAVRPIRLRRYTGSHSWARAMRAAIRERDRETAEILLRRTGGALANVSVVPFHQDLHRNARNKRFNVRRWSGLMTLDVESWDSYVKKMIPRVGNAKGGWAPAVLGLGGSVAAWVKRHSYAGTLTDRLNAPGQIYIDIQNNSTWGKSGADRRILTNALKARAVKIQRKIAATERRAAESALRGGVA